MTTIAIPRGKIDAIQQPARSIPVSGARSSRYSVMALASIGCIALFLSFIALYQTSIFEHISFTTKALLSFLFVVAAPGLALYFSVTSLHRYVHNRSEVRGLGLAYVSFVISAVYFVTALAMPFVLIGFYLMYVYIW